MQQDSSAAQARLLASDLRRAEEARQAAEAEVAQLLAQLSRPAADRQAAEADARSTARS